MYRKTPCLPLLSPTLPLFSTYTFPLHPAIPCTHPLSAIVSTCHPLFALVTQCKPLSFAVYAPVIPCTVTNCLPKEKNSFNQVSEFFKIYISTRYYLFTSNE